MEVEEIIVVDELETLVDRVDEEEKLVDLGEVEERAAQDQLIMIL